MRPRDRTPGINNPSCGLSNTNLLFQAITHDQVAVVLRATATQSKVQVFNQAKRFSIEEMFRDFKGLPKNKLINKNQESNFKQ